MNRRLKKTTNILMLIVFTFIVTLGTISFIPVPTAKVAAAVTTPTPTPTPTSDLAVFVSGYVFDYITNQKIAGATIHMDTASATTDANGYYRIGHVFMTRPSSVTLTVSAADYTTQNISVTVPASGDANRDIFLVSTVPVTPTSTPTPTPGWKTATVTVGDATNITSTSATVSATATVSGSGQDPDIMLGIDYWETADSSVVIHTDGVFTFYYPTTITRTLTGLKPATSYSYKGSMAAGETKTFTTLADGTPTPSPTPTPVPQVNLRINLYWAAMGTVELTPGGFVAQSTTISYRLGTPVRLQASTYFDRWAGAYTGTENPITIVMDSDKTISVYFRDLGTPTPTPPTITPTPTPPTITPTPTPPTTTPTPTPPTTTPTPTPGGIKVQFFNGNTAATINSIYTNFKVVNTGPVSASLANVKMRYYFTNDGTQANSFACDYSTIGSGNVTGSFTTIAKTNADRYLEIGFTSGAGTLAAGASAEVKGRVWKSDWSNFTQTNDYSFNATDTNYVDWTKTTGYISGALNWGTEP